jgi:hypothetical protein
MIIKPTYEEILKQNKELQLNVATLQEALFSTTHELAVTLNTLEDMEEELKETQKELTLASADVHFILKVMKKNKFDMTFVKRLKTVEK